MKVTLRPPFSSEVGYCSDVGYYCEELHDIDLEHRLKKKQISSVIVMDPKIVMRSLVSISHGERKIMKLMIDQGLVKV
jgi:hypothetical protein